MEMTPARTAHDGGPFWKGLGVSWERSGAVERSGGKYLVRTAGLRQRAVLLVEGLWEP